MTQAEPTSAAALLLQLLLLRSLTHALLLLPSHTAGGGHPHGGGRRSLGARDGGRDDGRQGAHQAAQPGHAARRAAGPWRRVVAGGVGAEEGVAVLCWRACWHRQLQRSSAAENRSTADLSALPSSPLNSQHVPPEWNALCYCYEGAGRISDKAAQPEHAYVLHNEGDTVRTTARALLCLVPALLCARSVLCPLWPAAMLRLSSQHSYSSRQPAPGLPPPSTAAAALDCLQVTASGGEGGLKFLLIVGRPIGEHIVQCEWWWCE